MGVAAYLFPALKTYVMEAQSAGENKCQSDTEAVRWMVLNSVDENHGRRLLVRSFLFHDENRAEF